MSDMPVPGGSTLELERLLAAARDAGPTDRISFRDPIAQFGDAAVVRLQPWVADQTLGAFAVRAIERAAAKGSPQVAVEALEQMAERATSSRVAMDALEAVERLRSGGRTKVRSSQGSGGAVFHGLPDTSTTYSPPLSPGELALIGFFHRTLPGGWDAFVRPHLDGDRPAVVLLHPQNGAMVWDVREQDLSRCSVNGDLWVEHGPQGQRTHLNPLDQVNRTRKRIYQEYLPSLGEAIDDQSRLYGVVKAGIYFPTGSPRDLDRLGLSSSRETVVTPEGLHGSASSVVPNAWRAVDMADEWYRELSISLSRYHPPTFGGVPLSPTQERLVSSEFAPGRWRVEGVAGGGKSLVLARRAARLAARGHNTLLLTYNITLANYCRGLAMDAPDRFENANLTVRHFHGLCGLILDRASRQRPIPPEEPETDLTVIEHVDGPALQREDYFDVVWPRETLEALQSGDIDQAFRFDAILVDEAQDFSPSYLDVVEKLATDEAEITVAYDRAQRLYARKDGIAAWAGSWSDHQPRRLDRGRRLRSRLAAIASRIAEIGGLPTVAITPDPEDPTLFREAEARWIEVDDPAHQLAAVLTLLRRWREEPGHDPSEVTVLAPSAQVGSALVELLRSNDIQSNHIFPRTISHGSDGQIVEERRNHKVSFSPHDQRTKVSTVHSYKGWEAGRIVLVLRDCSDMDVAQGADELRRIYVAATRPRSGLFIVATADAHGIRDLFDVEPDVPDTAAVAMAGDLLAATMSAKTHDRPLARVTTLPARDDGYRLELDWTGWTPLDS